MRTTVEFAEDTARAVSELRQEEGLGVSEAVNVLIRRGLMAHQPVPRFRQQTAKLGLRLDVSNVAAALEDLDGTQHR